MAINFAAAKMQGYNYPHISILTLTTDAELNFISYPAFDDVARLLANGVIPVLTLRSVDPDGMVLQDMLLYLSIASDDEIEFYYPAMRITFKKGQKEPVIT